MKAFRFVLSLLVVSGFLGVIAGVAGAAPGDLDRFFGREGTAVVEDIPGSWASADDMVVGPGNAIYVLREETRCGQVQCSSDLVVTRYDAHGALDASYGVAGLARVPRSPGYGLNGKGSLAVTSAGEVVVATTVHGSIFIARLNPDGSLDSSFAVGGTATFPVGIFAGRAQVALDQDGRIVVGAESAIGYDETTVAVSRYTPQGSPDPTFNGGRPVITSLGSGLGGLDLTPDSKVVVAGPRCCRPTNNTVHVAQLTQSGVFDRRFGVRGHRFVDDVAPAAKVGAVLTLPNGKIDVVGAGKHDGVAFALRLRAGGRLDTSFGNHGVAYVRKSNLSVAGAAVDEGGRLVIAGSSPGQSARRGYLSFAVIRRLANGRPDRIFGGGTVVRFAPIDNATYVNVYGLDLQSGGRIVALIEAGACERGCDPGKRCWFASAAAPVPLAAWGSAPTSSALAPRIT